MAFERKYSRAYLDDFRKNESGVYEYVGDWYRCEYLGADYRRRLLGAWTAAAVMLVSVFLAGNVNAPGLGTGLDNSLIVLLPWLVELFGSISVVWAMCRLTVGRNPMRAYVYAATVEKLPARAGLTAVFSVCTAAGELLVLVRRSGESNIRGTVLLLVLEAAAFLAGVRLLRGFCRLRWEKNSQKNEKDLTGN